MQKAILKNIYFHKIIYIDALPFQRICLSRIRKRIFRHII